MKQYLNGELVDFTVEEGGSYGPSFEETRNRKLSALAAKRWEVETGGITFNGARIETDDRSKLLILGKRTKAMENPEGTTRWKVAPGTFADIPNAAIIATADAVEAHVQSCFDHEAEVSIAILTADTIEALDAIDINADWPA